MVETSERAHKDLEFFKVFLPEFSSRELVIPPAFIDILEKPLPNEALLFDEIGRLWYVETEQEDTEERFRVVFKKGWEKFAKDQSLEFGDFLVFVYDGDHSFSVKIFAKGGVKKDLTVDKSRVSVEEEPFVTKPVGFSTKPVDFSAKPLDISAKPECSRKDCGVRKRKWKPKRGFVAVDLVNDEPEDVLISEIKAEYSENTRRKLNRPRDVDESWWVRVKKHKGLEEQVEPVYKTKNPHFVRTITHTSLHRMEIPATLLKSNGIELEENVELCDENGKKWPFKIVQYDRGITFSKEPWLCFCESHMLMKTNKCLFEFIVEESNGRCNEIHVRVFRGRLDTTTTRSGYQVLAM